MEENFPASVTKCMKLTRPEKTSRLTNNYSIFQHGTLSRQVAFTITVVYVKYAQHTNGCVRFPCNKLNKVVRQYGTIRTKWTSIYTHFHVSLPHTRTAPPPPAKKRKVGQYTTWVGRYWCRELGTWDAMVSNMCSHSGEVPAVSKIFPLQKQSTTQTADFVPIEHPATCIPSSAWSCRSSIPDSNGTGRWVSFMVLHVCTLATDHAH